MVVQYTIENVIKAIQGLYQPNSDRKEYENYLIGFPDSCEFWSILDKILSVSDHGETVSVYMAQALKNKCFYKYNQVPSTEQLVLMEKIVHYYVGTKFNNKPLYNQLASSLAYCIMQSKELMSVRWVVDKFTDLPENRKKLLTFLRIFPNTVEMTMAKPIGRKRRKELKDDMIQCSSIVVEFLGTMYDVHDEKLGIECIDAFSSWIVDGAVELKVAVSCKLTEIILTILNNVYSTPILHEVAVNCMMSYVELFRRLYIYKVPETIDITNHLYNLYTPFTRCVQLEYIDKCTSFSFLFIEMGEMVLDMYEVEQKIVDTKIFELLFSCCDFLEVELIRRTLPFWSRFCQIAFTHTKTENSEMIKSYLNRLLEKLYSHAEIDIENPRDNDLEDFRFDLRDLVIDMIPLIDVNSFSATLVNNLKNANYDGVTGWEKVEHVIYFLSMIIFEIKDETFHEHLKPVVHTLLKIPQTTHELMRETVIIFLGKIGKFLDLTEEELFQNVVNCIILNLVDRDSVDWGSNSLCRLYKLRYKYFKCNLNYMPILQVYIELDKKNLHSYNSHDNFSERLFSIFTTLTLDDEISKAIKLICTMHLEKIQIILTNQSKNATLYYPHLCVLTTAFSKSILKNYNQHPLLEILFQFFPQSSQIIVNNLNDDYLIEKVCRLFKNAVRLLKLECSELLNPLVREILPLYKSSKHSSFIYLASILVDVYGENTSLINGFVHVLQTFWTNMQEVDEEGKSFKQYGETIEDFFRLCYKISTKQPLIFIESNIFPEILNYAVENISNTYRHSLEAVVTFLNEFIRFLRKNEQTPKFEKIEYFKQSFLNIGGSLTYTIIKSIFTDRDTMTTSYRIEPIYHLKYYNKLAFESWLMETLENLRNTNVIDDTIIDNQFLQSFYNSVLTTTDLPKFESIFLEMLNIMR